jgi:hypothetical protein
MLGLLRTSAIPGDDRQFPRLIPRRWVHTLKKSKAITIDYSFSQIPNGGCTQRSPHRPALGGGIHCCLEHSLNPPSLACGIDQILVCFILFHQTVFLKGCVRSTLSVVLIDEFC